MCADAIKHSSVSEHNKDVLYIDNSCCGTARLVARGLSGKVSRTCEGHDGYLL